VIVTRTPLRLPIGGGGSDLPSFYATHGGHFLSAAIDKYVYLVVNQRFQRSIRVSYSRTEIVEDVEAIQHPIVRECLRMMELGPGLEIVSIADLPAGTGMGSSGSFTVGLLLALHALKGQTVIPQQLAEEAFEIEAVRLRGPVGKQDPYVAAFGGVRGYSVDRDGGVTVAELAADDAADRLATNLMMFYTGLERDASEVLAEQGAAIASGGSATTAMQAIVAIGHEIEQAMRAGSIDDVGRLMHRHWEAKRATSGAVTTADIDRWYEAALRSGALGGKVMGAGGGGFLLLYAPPADQASLRAAMIDLGLRELSFRLEPQGAAVVLEA